MSFIFTLINTWGFRKQKLDAQLRHIFSALNPEKNISEVVDYELHGLQFNRI